MQMDLHKTLYPFYTIKKIPHESTRSVCIILKSYSGGVVFKFAKKLHFLSSFTVLLNWGIIQYHYGIIVNSRQLSLNWTSTTAFAVLTLVCGLNLTSQNLV